MTLGMGAIIGIIAAIIVILTAHVFASLELFKVAAMKGWGQKKYFVIPLLLWLPGYLIIVALPDRAGETMAAVISDDLPEL